MKVSRGNFSGGRGMGDSISSHVLMCDFLTTFTLKTDDGRVHFLL